VTEKLVRPPDFRIEFLVEHDATYGSHRRALGFFRGLHSRRQLFANAFMASSQTLEARVIEAAVGVPVFTIRLPHSGHLMWNSTHDPFATGEQRGSDPAL
jgi:hypothetical protein